MNGQPAYVMNPKLHVLESDHKDGAAFTLIELLVVMATLAVLATMLLPALAGTRPNIQAFQCMNNHRQIVLAWRMYADDNNDLMPPNDWYSGPPGLTPYFAPPRNLNWVGGIMDSSPADSQNTNTVMLVQWAALGPYNRSAATYHCPADKSFAPGQAPRVRSVSMNAAVGTAWNQGTPAKGSPVGSTWLSGTYSTGPNNSIWQTYGKISAIVRPKPEGLFVILEEHPDSISDPVFFVAMGATAVNGNPTSNTILDSPASYHNGACNFAFADEHVELHKWVGSRIEQGGNNYPAADSIADLRWIQQRTTAAK